MDREKQIDEIDELLKKSIKNGLLDTKWLSKTIYDAEYRRQSEVAREIFEEIDRMCIDTFGNFNHRVFAECKKKYTEEKK